MVVVCALFAGCGSEDPAATGSTQPTAGPIEDDTVCGLTGGEDGAAPALAEVLDPVCFVESTDAELRTSDEIMEVTNLINYLEAADIPDKELRGFVFEVNIDGQWWTDSVHEHQDSAFNRQTRLLDAGLVQPVECRVRRVLLLTP